MNTAHTYAARLVWDGNEGEGTASYEGYGRGYRVLIEGKPELYGTADPAFRGDADRHNPEDLFLASISACHMLTYLALCARSGIRVVAYADDAVGRMVLTGDGGGRFEEVTLSPVVAIDDTSNTETAMQLHRQAHRLCFIASSCNFPIRHEPRIEVS